MRNRLKKKRKGFISNSQNYVRGKGWRPSNLYSNKRKKKIQNIKRTNNKLKRPRKKHLKSSKKSRLTSKTKRAVYSNDLWKERRGEP